jgi:integrase/recombinase XerD
VEPRSFRGSACRRLRGADCVGDQLIPLASSAPAPAPAPRRTGKVSGKGGKTRHLPLCPGINALIHDYLAAAGYDADENGALFRPVKNNTTRRLEGQITADGVYKLVRAYSALLGFEIGADALRATAATNALDHEADIAKVQEWLWPREHRHHAHLRSPENRPEDSPTFKVAY